MHVYADCDILHFTLGDFDVKLHVNACSSLRNFVFRLFQSLFHDGLDLD